MGVYKTLMYLDWEEKQLSLKAAELKKNQENIKKIKRVFIGKGNKAVNSLDIIRMTGEGNSAKNISEILLSSKGYIENEKRKIADKIIENFADIHALSDNPTHVITAFYFKYGEILEQV